VNKLAGVSQVLGWMGDLDRIARDSAERERKRDEKHRAAVQREQLAFRQAVESLDARLAAVREQAEAAHRERLVAAGRRAEARASAIREALLSSRTQRTGSVESAEGTSKQRIQTRREELDAACPRELAEVDADYAAITGALGRHYAGLTALTTRTGRSFQGYRSLMARTLQPVDPSALDLTQPAARLLEQIEAHVAEASATLDRARASVWLRLFGPVPPGGLAIVVLLVHGLAAAAFAIARLPPAWPLGAGVSAAVLLGLGAGLRALGVRRLAPAVRRIADEMAMAAKLHDVCTEKAAMERYLRRERIEKTYEALRADLDREWQAATEKADSWRMFGPRALRDKMERALRRNESLHARAARWLQEALPRTVAGREEDVRRERERLTKAHETALADLDRGRRADRAAMEAEREGALAPVRDALAAAAAAARARFPDWSDAGWGQWSPPADFAHAAPFGTIRASGVESPLLLTFPDQGSLLFETQGPAREGPAAAMTNVMLRLLTSSPPGKLRFTIVDPVALGQNFAGLMHLADYEDSLVNGRIWTQPAQIEKQLAAIGEHMEKVIQTYLRNEYRTITDYNERAGAIAEKYHVLIVADFPTGFTDLAVERLAGIAATGARCGVHTIVHWDRRQRPPAVAALDELRKHAVVVRSADGALEIAGASPGAGLRIEDPPEAETANRLLHEVGRASIDASRVEVPFGQVAPAETERWSLDTSGELKVAVGRTGATKLQYLALGQDTRQHALIVGKTGSGKSTLFHVAITNLSLWCAPDQVEFYLVDFKKGVEFKCYATHRLPHARVVAIESDREFGLSVLQRVDEELRRRGEWFRDLGVQDIRGYKRAGGREPIPRTLLIVDEFQEFFVEDDRIAQTAALLLDRIVRQGRAFGIHVLLGSQTLGGAYTLARTTLGQMVVRIALQCNEADAFLIMDEGNPAPRLLSRPGEAVYNDAAGAIEGNSPFQVVWLPDEERDRRLGEVRAHAERNAKSLQEPIVFEGNAPASIAENRPLRELLDGAAPAGPARVWLGSPNSIKGPTEVVFRRQGGSHLLVVGQREETALTLLAVALMTLSARHVAGTARFLVLDGSPPESPQRAFLDAAAAAVPHGVERVRPADVDAVMKDLAAELDRREGADDPAGAPSVYVLIDGLQKFKRLRFEEDFSFSGGGDGSDAPAGAVLDRILREGAALGIHVIVTCDGHANVQRFLSRKAVAAFTLRVLFQMSANDSAALIDSTAASMLGLHRAILHNEQDGFTETFRPYARPDRDWLARTAADLRRLHAAGPA